MFSPWGRTVASWVHRLLSAYIPQPNTGFSSLPAHQLIGVLRSISVQGFEHRLPTDSSWTSINAILEDNGSKYLPVS